MILLCETRRDILNAPEWKAYINTAVDEKIEGMEKMMTDSIDKRTPEKETI